MKPRRQHPKAALSAIRIRNISKPGRYADGNGLYLVVDISGAKRWVLRTMIRGRRRDMGLGSLTLVTLAEARELAVSHRKNARAGGDPITERRLNRKPVPTFADAARLVHAQHRAGWKNGKHADQWLTTLERHAFPIIGDIAVNAIDTSDILRVLTPIWTARAETARRVRQRIKVVLDWAHAAGHRTGVNPVDGVTRGLPKVAKIVRHHAAMPFADVPMFMRRIGEADALGALALRFLVMTATRTSEVLHAKWSEIDIANGVWTVPAGRTKTGRAHRVPLAEQCLEILHQARLYQCGSELVFPGASPAKPMSSMVFLMLLRRMALPYTAHGFRSAFRDWSAEESAHAREVCEMALGHAVANKVEAAYRRGDLFEKRRALMRDWANFCSSQLAQVATALERNAA